VPSCATLLFFYAFSAAAGFMLMEVNINTVCELGGGAISLQSMVTRTLGPGGAAIASAAYVFLHYSLLVAYIARASTSIAGPLGSPLPAVAALFTATIGALCYFSSNRILDVVNSSLLVLVILSFLALFGIAAPGIAPENLASASWPAVIPTLPVVALSFVFQNIVPVVVSSLEGDIPRVRIAVLVGLAVPLLMFIGWEAAILGCAGAGVHFLPERSHRDA
jgi:tyrosine-specific transport protein